MLHAFSVASRSIKKRLKISGQTTNSNGMGCMKNNSQLKTVKGLLLLDNFWKMAMTPGANLCMGTSSVNEIDEVTFIFG